MGNCFAGRTQLDLLGFGLLLVGGDPRVADQAAALEAFMGAIQLF